MSTGTVIGKVYKVVGCNAKIHIKREVMDTKYGKRLQKTTKFMAHDNLGVKEGDIVLVKECAPISKLKRHIIVEVKK